MKLFNKKENISTTSSDEEIVSACIKENRKAQKILYDRYASKMFGVCLGYAKEYALAKDFLQEGFLKVFLNLKKFGNKGSFEGWVRKVIVNHIIDYYRLKSSNIRLIELKEYYYLDANTFEINDVVKHFNIQDFLALTRSLSNGYRTVLNLYYVEEYNHKEIAEKLNISVGTSKSQLSRAKKALSKIVYKELKIEKEVHYGT